MWTKGSLMDIQSDIRCELKSSWKCSYFLMRIRKIHKSHLKIWHQMSCHKKQVKVEQFDVMSSDLIPFVKNGRIISIKCNMLSIELWIKWKNETKNVTSIMRTISVWTLSAWTKRWAEIRHTNFCFSENVYLFVYSW